jgi:hypothetical protein
MRWVTIIGHAAQHVQPCIYDGDYEEFEGFAADGRRRTMQYFERAVLAYYPDDNSVRLDSLGWASLIQDRLKNSASLHSIR